MKTIKSIIVMLAALLSMGAKAATTVTIPTTAGTYIDWNACNLTGAKIENSGANIGSTGASTVATFTISNTTQQDYILTFATGNKNNSATIHVQLTASDETNIINNWTVSSEKTGDWTPTTTHNYFISNLPVGTYTLRFTTSDVVDYAGNWGKLAFYTTDSFNTIPGTISIASGGYAGGARLENSDTNVGWISNGTSATYSFICSEAGVYKMTIPMTRYGDGTITTIVTDDETGTEEANGVWTMTNPTNYEDTDVPVEGELTTGLKTLTMQFATTASFLFNYKDFTMTRVGDHYSKVTGVTIEGQTVTVGDDSDWYCQLPASYDATTTFSVTSLYGTVAATAEGIDITDNGNGSFTMPTPAPGTTTTVTLTLTPAAGTFSSKTTYTLKLFRIGEISLTDVLVDDQSIDVLSDMNTNQTATYNNIYTAVPTVKVKVVDGTTVTAPAPTISGTTATYAIHVEMAGKTKDYTLVVDGLHIYQAGASDETVHLKYTAEGNDKTKKIWSNGLYSLSPVGDGWGNSGFKLSKNDNPFTMTVPSDVVVKQFIIREFSDNYAPGSLATLTSEGATAIYIPAKHDFVNGTKYDLIVNIDGHQAGTPIVFSFTGGSQITGWYELTIEKQAITTVPVLTEQQVTVVNNHAVVALTFDREMTNTTATINNTTVNAEGGSATLYFPVWGLNYSTNYTLNIAVGAAKDTYGNSNAEAINIAVNTAAKPVVAAAAYDYVVSTVDELKAAVAAVNSSNNNASAARKTIFLKNGDYNMGTTELRLSGYNISLIGESRDGVIIRGQRSGISNPTVNLRDRTGFYLQDLTLLNDLNYYLPLQDKESTNGGVAVAVYGGDKTVMKNVLLLGTQDTQVTGHRAYFEDCEIHGTVDFICGGGDNFYYNTNLVVRRNSSVITAPSTSSALKWGYVFQQCTIDGANGASDAGYGLGRPWQDTPRCYYLNTTMKVLPNDNGWNGMGNLPTYFYEYNSMNADGSAIDLSVRGNSATSTNHYTPVLTDAEALKFNVENVLGGTDSWLPTDFTNEVAAPTVSLSGSTLSWTAVDDARCYIIFKDGKYLANQTATSYEMADEGIYTVRAANEMGGLGTASTDIVFKRTITAGNWSTIVVPFDIASDDIETVFGAGASVAELTDNSTETTLNFTTTLTGSKMKANQPYAIKVASDFASAVIDGVTIVEATPTQTVGNWQFVGTYATGNIPQGSYFFSGNKLWQAADDTNTIAPFRAYFKPATSASRNITFFIDGEPTGVNEVRSNMDDGRGDCFNLAGQRVAKPTKGLYIVNGKKVVIK